MMAMEQMIFSSVKERDVLAYAAQGTRWVDGSVNVDVPVFVRNAILPMYRRYAAFTFLESYNWSYNIPTAWRNHFIELDGTATEGMSLTLTSSFRFSPFWLIVPIFVTAYAFLMRSIYKGLFRKDINNPSAY